jgi:hypothetical protein
LSLSSFFIQFNGFTSSRAAIPEKFFGSPRSEQGLFQRIFWKQQARPTNQFFGLISPVEDDICYKDDPCKPFLLYTNTIYADPYSITRTRRKLRLLLMAMKLKKQ